MPKSRPISFPSPLPRSYVEITLARLVPPPTALDQLSDRELRALVEQERSIRSQIEADPARFFVPHATGDQRAFLEADYPAKSVYCFFAGNKGGKTAARTIKTAERLLGRALWDVETRGHIRWPVPQRWLCYAEDFDAHEDITIPNLLTWIPQHEIQRVNRNSAGHAVSIEFVNGSHLRLQTYEQGLYKGEGKDWDGVSFDEPPPHDIYVGSSRGLVARGGVMFIAATLIKEPWLYDEQDKPHVAVFGGTIDDNTWLNAAAKQAFKDTLTDDEKEVRLSGKPSTFTGRVYKTFTDDPPFVIPDHPVPERAPVVLVVDPHERRPPHCLWLYVDEKDRLIFFDWCLAGRGSGGQLDAIFADIQDVSTEHKVKPLFVLMDPKRAMSTQMGGSCWKDAFEDRGYDVDLAHNSHQIGHALVKDRLDPQNPGIIFMERCLGKNGPIFQMQRYAWDDGIRRKRELNPKEQVRDLHKDFPDCVRYAALAELSYRELTHGTGQIRWAEAQRARLHVGSAAA